MESAQHSYGREIVCAFCRKPALVAKRGANTAKTCSRECFAAARAARLRDPAESRRMHDALRVDRTRTCDWCSIVFQARNGKQRFCSRSCSARWMAKYQPISPEVRRANGKKVSAATRGKPAPKRGEHMRLNNPTRNPEVIAKISAKLKGRTFLARGGNGQLTKPQIMLAEATGLLMEYPVATATVKGRFPSLPPTYKVDLAHPDTKLAIEVDGNSHNTKKWRFLDRRKTEILNCLGWYVLRFKNERVLSDLTGVISEIRECMILRSKGITPTLPTEC